MSKKAEKNGSLLLGPYILRISSKTSLFKSSSSIVYKFLRLVLMSLTSLSLGSNL